MLPSLSDRWGAKLQVLVPSHPEPARASARRNALEDPKKIDAVSISASGKGSKTRYAVKEQSDFKDAADELHHIVDSAHSGKRCELCSAILNWFVLGENPCAAMLMFVSNERIARKLTKFLQDLLALTIKYASNDIQGCCAGQILIPLAVHKFLFNPPATCAA
ncbi:uncharacterized protein PITG_15821 [Phytophthora infestans T30-4]|uniref:Uncharacterized protein n=1 Tax=Phytophthora infestans (strain T30-4) TaxID=403677 RepID=D0NS73_PHYIT|nr:uncharacterized protein PITG_15821 [Phytophthora infestans T30-4]EEY63477.1 conserved hypothetical protein [Phytophthora infestans T30-4]|eukprot:XP_002898064.1 conserved hypothetical protein [Phytophthora infestans T30-4]